MNLNEHRNVVFQSKRRYILEVPTTQIEKGKSSENIPKKPSPSHKAVSKK